MLFVMKQRLGNKSQRKAVFLEGDEKPQKDYYPYHHQWKTPLGLKKGVFLVLV